MDFSMKHGLILLAVIVLSVFGYVYLKKPEPVLVKMHTVSSGEVLETVSNTRVGTIKACRRALLAPGTGGEVIALNVKEGDKVEQDQILLEVWNQGLKAKINLSKSEISSAQAVAEQSCHTAAGSDRAAKRLMKLKKHNHIVSEEAIDLARTRALAQQAACRSAKLQVDVSKARLQVARAAVERTILHAPFAGIIAEVNAELGEYITPSPPGIPTLPAIDLIDNQCLYISAPIDEVDAPLVKMGMQVCVTLDAFPQPRCSGKVVRIAPYVLEKEKQARTVEVEVQLTDQAHIQQLMPGYSADIEVMIQAQQDTIRVPTEAIIEGDQVWVVNQAGLIESRAISKGLKNWHFTEVLSGLDIGEQIVLSIGREGLVAGVYIVAEP